MKKLKLLIVLTFFALAAVIANCSKQETDTSQTEVVETELPSLQAKLDQKKMDFEQRASEDVKRIFNEGVEAVAKSGVLETALNVGDTAPDFTLPNAVGKSVTLSNLLQKGPIVLIWYRGGW